MLNIPWFLRMRNQGYGFDLKLNEREETCYLGRYLVIWRREDGRGNERTCIDNVIGRGKSILP